MSQILIVWFWKRAGDPQLKADMVRNWKVCCDLSLVTGATEMSQVWSGRVGPSAVMRRKMEVTHECEHTPHDVVGKISVRMRVICCRLCSGCHCAASKFSVTVFSIAQQDKSKWLFSLLWQIILFPSPLMHWAASKCKHRSPIMLLTGFKIPI